MDKNKLLEAAMTIKQCCIDNYERGCVLCPFSGEDCECQITYGKTPNEWEIKGTETFKVFL